MKNMEPIEYILISAAILVGAILFSKLVRWLITRAFKRAAKRIQLDPTNYNFLKNGISFLIFLLAVIGIFFIIPGLRTLGSTMLAGAGIFAAAVGFASQQAFSNIVSGIFIVVFRPFGVGDFIKLSDTHYGTVEDITLRHTVIRNPENRRVIIPNSVISSETILNSSIADAKICSQVEFDIAYHSNIDKAIALIQEEAMKHPNLFDNRTDEEKEAGDPVVRVRVIALANWSVRLRAYLWAGDNGKAFVMKCDILKSVKERFDQEGIEIPYPYQNLIHHNSQQEVNA